MSLNTEVDDYTNTDDGAIVDVRVDSLNVIPDEFQEIRARAKALVATGFASSASGVLDDVELGEVDRLTQTLSVNQISEGSVRESKLYTVKVDVPMN